MHNQDCNVEELAQALAPLSVMELAPLSVMELVEA